MAKTNKLGINPTAGYILVEPVEATRKTDSGIYLPETSEEKPQKGKVLAVGADEVLESGKTRKSPVKVNDIVVYKKWGGSEVKVDGKEYLFSKFEDILAIVK
ncbi:co-chaperone GroES [Patescibacteria group bacterium]